MLKVKSRSEVEHLILFSGIALAIVKCLHDDKLKSFGLASINSNIVAVIFMLSIATIMKGLYDLQFINFNDNYIGRSHGDKGLFCIMLLPVALIFNCINYATLLSNEYKFVTLISIEVALSSVIVLSLQRQKYLQNVFFTVVTVTLVTSMLLHMVSGVYYVKLLLFIELSIFSQCLFFWLLDTALVSFSQSFTIGELNLVCQGIVIFLTAAIFHFNALIHRGETYISDLNSMIFVAITGLFVVLFLLKIFPILRLTIYFYIVCIGIAGITILAAMGVAFKQNPFLWFLNFICETKSRILLMIYCGVCSGLTFLYVFWQQTRFEQSSTVTRKFFHGIVVALYIPVFVFDQQLLLLASSLIFGIFVLLECIRVLNIFPLGNIIQNAFSVFLDEKDSGVLMLTHLYLFLGCSVTLWIHSFDFKGMNCVCVTSGILSLGFGDSAASIVGTYFGKHKWPHTKKTYEGTFGAFIIQFFGTLCIFFVFKQIPSLFNIVYVLIATAHSVLLETFTTQVDNLISPFYLFIMLVCL